MGKCVELSVCLNTGRKMVYFYFDFQQKIEELYQKTEASILFP